MSNHDLFPEVTGAVLEHADDPEIRHKWPESLAEMLAVIEAAFQREGCDSDEARRRAFTAVRALSHHMGGHAFYLPKGERLERALRDREIWERSRGDNIRQLALDYGLTDVQIYAILREQRALARNRFQADLFEA